MFSSIQVGGTIVTVSQGWPLSQSPQCCSTSVCRKFMQDALQDHTTSMSIKVRPLSNIRENLSLLTYSAVCGTGPPYFSEVPSVFFPACLEYKDITLNKFLAFYLIFVWSFNVSCNLCFTHVLRPWHYNHPVCRWNTLFFYSHFGEEKREGEGEQLF